MKHTFSNREAIKTGWRIFKANWKFVLGLGALTILVKMFLSGIGAAVDRYLIISAILNLAGILISIIISLGWTKISLSLIRSNHTTRETFKTEPKTWLHLIKTSIWFALYFIRNVLVVALPFIITGLIGLLTNIEWLQNVSIFLGLATTVLMGNYMIIRYQFISYVVIDHPDLKSRDVFKKAGTLTDGVWWKLFGFMIVTALVTLLGAVCLVVGLVAAIPTVMLAKTQVYEILKKRHETRSVSSNE